MKFEMPDFLKRKNKETSVFDADSKESSRGGQQNYQEENVAEKKDRDTEIVERVIEEIKKDEAILAAIKNDDPEDFGIVYLKSTGGLFRLGKDSQNRLHLMDGGISKEGDWSWNLRKRVAKEMEEKFLIEHIIVN